MKIIMPSWKDKYRNIDILIEYLNDKSMMNLKREYQLTRFSIKRICKIQLRELLEIPSDIDFDCHAYIGNQDAILLAHKYKEFLRDNS